MALWVCRAAWLCQRPLRHRSRRGHGGGGGLGDVRVPVAARQPVGGERRSIPRTSEVTAEVPCLPSCPGHAGAGGTRPAVSITRGAVVAAPPGMLRRQEPPGPRLPFQPQHARAVDHSRSNWKCGFPSPSATLTRGERSLQPLFGVGRVLPAAAQPPALRASPTPRTCG